MGVELTVRADTNVLVLRRKASDMSAEQAPFFVEGFTHEL